MKKQQLIQQAYGELHSILADNMNENGFVSVEMINSHENNGMDYETFGYDYKDVETVLGQPGNYLWRPVALKGIETNNGWTKIESEDDLPKYNSGGKFKCLTELGNEVDLNGGNAVRNAYKFSDVTHYRLVIDFPKPLY